jgi:hypothetical protein
MLRKILLWIQVVGLILITLMILYLMQLQNSAPDFYDGVELGRQLQATKMAQNQQDQAVVAPAVLPLSTGSIVVNGGEYVMDMVTPRIMKIDGSCETAITNKWEANQPGYGITFTFDNVVDEKVDYYSTVYFAHEGGISIDYVSPELPKEVMYQIDGPNGSYQMIQCGQTIYKNTLLSPLQ